MNDRKLSPKIAVIGTGMVGSSFAYALAIKGLARELALINRTPERAEGEAMDLNHGLSFLSPYDISNVCLSLPSIVGASGIERVITASLSNGEVRALQNSARILRESLKSLGW